MLKNAFYTPNSRFLTQILRKIEKCQKRVLRTQIAFYVPNSRFTHPHRVFLRKFRKSPKTSFTRFMPIRVRFERTRDFS